MLKPVKEIESMKPKPILKIKRKRLSPKSTIGDFYFADDFECRILEDPWRDPDNSGNLDADEKIPGETCIPTGTYRVVLSYSNRFKRVTPEILGVPHFKYIRIHPGNRSVDTRGCPLTGTKHGRDVVYSSVAAFEKLMPKLEKACQLGKVYIKVSNHFGDPFEPIG